MEYLLSTYFILCTGGVSEAIFISLLIFKLFCRKGCMGKGGGEFIIYIYYVLEGRGGKART